MCVLKKLVCLLNLHHPCCLWKGASDLHDNTLDLLPIVKVILSFLSSNIKFPFVCDGFCWNSFFIIRRQLLKNMFSKFLLIFFIKLVSCSSRGIPTKSCFSHFKNLSSSIKHFFFKDIDIFLPSISKGFRKSRFRAAYWSLGTRLQIAIWSKYKPDNLHVSYLNIKAFIYLE